MTAEQPLESSNIYNADNPEPWSLTWIGDRVSNRVSKLLRLKGNLQKPTAQTTPTISTPEANSQQPESEKTKNG